MNRTYGLIKQVLWTTCLGLLFAAAQVMAAQPQPVTGAVSTTTNPTYPGEGSGHCKNGNEAVNCNIYDGKQYVWLSGLPDAAGVNNGTYFFAVLVPGGQGGNNDPNDGTPKNLSDDYDAYTNRIFEVNQGVISYAGTHDFDGIKIRLMPYADTTNPGGVYILAICSLADGYPVDPSNCKYDAFKIVAADTVAVRACKFNDLDGNGVNDAGEPLLANWKITGHGVYTGSADAGELSQITDASGCVDFTVKNLAGPVTFEETPQSYWEQTAPNAGGTYIGYTGDANGVATLTLPLVAGSEVTVYFGNYNLKEGGALQIAKGVSSEVDYAWTIKKDADKTLVKQSGTTATFNYTVNVEHDAGTWKLWGDITISNSTILTVDGLQVKDTFPAGGSCSIDPKVYGTYDPATATVSGITIGPGASLTMTWQCTMDPSSADFSTSGKNSVSLMLEDTTEIDFASVDYDFFGDKNAKVIDECIDVKDSVYGTLGTVCTGGSNPTTFTYSLDWTGTAGTCTKFDNTATFTTNDTGTTGSASKTVEICVGADLTVSKTATPAYKRTYEWKIDKDVDKTIVKQVGGNATFNYTVKAWQTGFTDSDWVVSGKITVTNPNDWEAITFDASDATPGGTCTVTGGTGVIVAKSSSVTVDYTCTFGSNPGSGTNTATVTWDASAAYTPSGTASGTADYTFGAPTTLVYKTITVTDTYAGTLGTVTATDSAPWATKTFTYSRTVPVPTWACTTYDNTATITETGQSDSETVKVCGPMKTGALTMGFWQNKNGQDIIKSYCGGTSGTSLAAFLNAYNPFKDFIDGAGCADDALYVYNLIKAANAAGASMNAMLKAQMLATALDVYFSDPTRGGNKINAPAPIGGVSVDLTKICTDLTCTAYEDSSSVFGGSPQTVLQMLMAASGAATPATTANPLASPWYSQDKFLQELAKDAFDAINNQKVFAP